VRKFLKTPNYDMSRAGAGEKNPDYDVIRMGPQQSIK
jgi:hypothetical protein